MRPYLKNPSQKKGLVEWPKVKIPTKVVGLSLYIHPVMYTHKFRRPPWVNRWRVDSVTCDREECQQ
jgi:hypothetical protein